MRAMRAEKLSGYEGLKLVDLPKPTVSDGKVLLRMTAARVTPLDHTILSGQFPLANIMILAVKHDRQDADYWRYRMDR